MRPFSIVVATWNSAAELPGLLDSAHEHLSTPLEWIFVDNASTDGTLELLDRRVPDATVLPLEENRGFAAANNAGVAAARHEVVVLLNPDVVLIDGSLAELAGLAYETGALCGSRLLNEDGTHQISAHPRPGGVAPLITAFWPGALMPAQIAARADPWRVRRRTRVGWLSAACLAGRADVLRGLGPFDERLHLFGEDTDLGIRATQRGVPSLFAPEVARVVHLGGRSTIQRFDDFGVRRKIDARRWVVRERLGPNRAALDLLTQGLTVSTRLAAKLTSGRDASYERAWLRIVCGGPIGR